MSVITQSSGQARAEFARQANASTVAQMSASEQAKADAARMDVLEDLRPDENGEFSSSHDFIRRFLAKLPGTEQAGMMDANGRLSQTGYARVRNAILAKAYGSSPVLERMVESMDDNMRNVGRALMRAAPEVAKARQMIDEGALFDVDIVPDLVGAVEELSRIKESGQAVSEVLAQAGIFGEQFSAETRELIQFLAENIRRPRVMGDFIKNSMDALVAAGNPNQGSIFGENIAPAKMDLIKAAKGQNNEGNGIETVQGNERNGTQSSESVGNETGVQRETAASVEEGNQGHAAEEVDLRERAKEQFKEALSDLGVIARDFAHANRMIPEKTPDLMPTLVKLFEAAIQEVGYNLKDLVVYVKKALKEDPRFKKIWNKIGNDLYKKAAQEAVDRAQKAAVIDGRLYDRKRDNFKVPSLSAFIDEKIIKRAEALIEKYVTKQSALEISQNDRVEAEGLLQPLIEKAHADKPAFDQKIIDITKKVGALGQILAPAKEMSRAVEKLVLDEGMNVGGIKDLLRSTIVVKHFAEAQSVIDEVGKVFTITREPVLKIV